MRALVCHRFGDYHDLRVEEFPAPELPPHGVRIAVEVASLSFSISLWIAGKYQVKPPLPFIPGAEVVGRVIETAPGVIACQPGQRVLALIGWSPVDERARYEPQVRTAFKQLFEWHAQGKIRPLVTETYPLEPFAEAQNAVLRRRTVGKVIVRVAA